MPRIMIADDDVTIQLELEEYLTHLGHTVVGTVDTGEDAVELAREMKPDLILMDVHLPVEIDGIAAAQKIKEEMDVAVVFVTGFGDPEDIERAKQVEPFGYVIKPFDEREINATIEIALYKKEMELKLRKANDQLNHANRDLKQEIKERKQAEEVLRESEEKYRTILESIEDGYFEVDVSGNFMFFNDSMCEILGYSKDELMGMNNRQYTDEENAKKLYQTFNTVYTTGKSDKGFDWEIIRKDGSKKYIEASVSLRKDSEGHPMGFRGIAREVAARRQAEEGLRESEAKYRRVSDNSPAVLYQFMMTPDGAFSFPYVSDVVEASIGISAEEIMKDSSKFLGMVHPEDQKMFQESIMKSVESLESFPLTFRCMKDGGVIWMEARGTPAPLADGGILWDGFLLDITDRKQAEEALQESEEKYRSMMESMYDPAYICSPDYRIEYMNSVMVKRTGRDAVGEHCYKMIHELDRKCPWCVHDKVQQDENCVIETVSPKDNRTYSVSHSPIKHADGSISKLTVYRDVTELKNMEQHLGQAQKMEAIGTLAGGVAHEFNNTLMGIMGNIELLKMNFSGDGGIDKHLESMKSAGHRMSRLTTQLLAYAEGGKYQPKDLKINDFVIETLPILQHDLNPEVRVETHFPKDISYINADYAQMQMVLSAILANSNEAIEDEGIIRITAENKDLEQDFTKQHPGLKPGSHVCLTIEDDGKGMDEEARNGIFEPFFTTKFQGRGMGMAAAHGIVKNHDGWISVDSELGKGTTVQIYLPAIEVEVEKPKKAKAEGGTGSGTILMIEDKDVVIEVTQAMLEMLGYRVMVAKTGKDAIHIAETFDGQIDLALLDIKLPDMEGGKVYPYIMKARPELKVIVFSGYSIDGPARRILDAGAQDYIQKPFSLAALSEKLKVVLEGK
jgi:two-component system, cell cycle sensor histidine kinase and response regulator CckA